MAFIPKDAKWFLAELVEEIRVQGRKRNIVHINYTLIEANSPEVAYQKATELGKECNTEYRNESGKKVTIRFKGLRNLDVIHDPLEHGCELLYVEKLGVSPEGLSKLVRKKNELEAFLPVRDRPGRPDFASGEIMKEIKKELGKKKK